MPMDVDTSSYPKPQAQPSLLDTVGKFQGLASGAIGLDQQRLKLMNDQFQTMNAELSNMANDPSITKDQAAVRLNRFADTFKMPPQVRQHMMAELQAAPDVASFAKFALTRGMSAQERVNNLYGTPGTVSNGQSATPVAVSPIAGVKPIANPIQLQPPPTAEGVNTNTGQRGMVGAQPAQIPEGSTPANSGIPGQYIPPTPNKLGGAVQPLNPSQPQPQPKGPATSMSPMWETGQKQYVEDQNLATQKLTALKPILQALPLIEGLRTGPTTAGWTNFVATLKANGIINTEANDPTAIYQEVNKKLSQYVQNSGSRSDAQQALNEESSPNSKTQINQALLKLVRDQIALDRVQAARAGAFQGSDYSKYGQHRASFPNAVDERAFGLDLMKPEERSTLVQDEAKKLKSKNAAQKQEATKFFNSLRIAKDQNFYSGQQ